MKKPWSGPREECPRCGSVVAVDGTYLADHEGLNGRKCPERARPTPAKRRHRGKSVFAIGVGLPTLGKGRR